MKLLEAVKTGRPFRRAGEVGWYMVVQGKIVMLSNAGYTRYTRYIDRQDDLEADDFEILPLEIPEWLEDTDE